MRMVCALLAGALCAPWMPVQETNAATRFGVAADFSSYPQATPKETLSSVLKAIDNKRIDYLLAQLSDPDFVDRRVAVHGSNFDALVGETTEKLTADMAALKLLRRFLQEGEWRSTDLTATVRLKDVRDRCVCLRKTQGRWFLENRYKAENEDR